ncbi:hypothetical protein Tco_0375788 [Tanacetum coccineum]
MVPRTVLTRSGPISLNTARPVNTVQPRTAVNNAGPMKNVINNAYSTARRPFNKITAANNSNFTKKVNTVKGIKVNTARPKVVISVVNGNKEMLLRPQHVGFGDQSTKHMIGNKSYLTYCEEINGGFVTFRGNSKGGKITGKDFKLTDESHVLLKVPRKDNMYSVDLKNVVPQGDDDEDVGAEANINNFMMQVDARHSPIPTYKEYTTVHPVEQIIGDLRFSTQTEE